MIILTSQVSNPRYYRRRTNNGHFNKFTSKWVL